MEHQLTATDLLRMAGGEAYWRGLYSAIEGLARGLEVRGNILYGRVLWLDYYRTQLHLLPPFENRCSCPNGGNCRHVVTLGLTFLHQCQRHTACGNAPTPEETCYYLVSMLAHYDLRGLAMQLLAAVPEATQVAVQYLERPGHWTEKYEYSLKWDEEC